MSGGGLHPVSWRDFVQRLREIGFEGPVSGGKHPKMLRGNLVLTIPNPHEETIGVGFFEASAQTGRGQRG